MKTEKPVEIPLMEQRLSDRELLFLALASSGAIKLKPIEIEESTEDKMNCSISQESYANLHHNCRALSDLFSKLETFDRTQQIDEDNAIFRES